MRNLLRLTALLALLLAGCEKNDPAPRVSVWDGSVTMPADLETLDKNTPRLTDESGVKYAVVRINSASELAWLRNAGLDECSRLYEEYGGLKFVLTTDIDLGGLPWVPVGEGFLHHFDGQGHKISNLNVSGYEYAGLFAELYGGIESWGGIIENLHVTSGIVAGKQCAGGICGTIFWRGNISGCSNAATVMATDRVAQYNTAYAGGICGKDGTISRCSNTGTIQSVDDAGGIAGCGAVRDSENRGSVTSTGGYAGGIAGHGYVRGCANRGAVVGSNAGGIIGHAYTSHGLYPADNYACYNTGSVTGTQLAGGICGNMHDTSMAECYNTGPVSGPRAGALCGEAQFIYTCYCFWASSSLAVEPFGFGNGISWFGYNVLMQEDQWPETEKNGGLPEYYYWALRKDYESGAWKSLGGWNGGKPVYPKLWWEK